MHFFTAETQRREDFALTQNASNRGGKEKSRRDHKDFAPIASCLRASAVKFFHPVE